MPHTAFDSQTKETLNTQVKKFGSECTLSDKFLKSICKADVGIVDLVLQDIAFKSRKIAPRASKTRNLTGIPKLDDANKAGTSKSQQCSLILTEGDSAKALAMSGLSVVGRDFYGVYPLKGKLLNVREARFDQVNKNKEIQNVIKILNIKRDKDYTTADARKSLRYGSVIIMADQDHDGSHIKGLVINFLQWFNPSLVRAEGFVRQVCTTNFFCRIGSLYERVHSLLVTLHSTHFDSFLCIISLHTVWAVHHSHRESVAWPRCRRFEVGALLLHPPAVRAVARGALGERAAQPDYQVLQGFGHVDRKGGERVLLRPR